MSRLSTEAEYMSLANLVAEVVWLKGLLFELHVPEKKTPVLWCDNLSTVLLATNPVLHARTKHIKLDLHFVREKLMQQEIEAKHVPAQDQLADDLTRAVPSSMFNSFRYKPSVENLSDTKCNESCGLLDYYTRLGFVLVYQLS